MSHHEQQSFYPTYTDLATGVLLVEAPSNVLFLDLSVVDVGHSLQQIKNQ